MIRKPNIISDSILKERLGKVLSPFLPAHIIIWTIILLLLFIFLILKTNPIGVTFVIAGLKPSILYVGVYGSGVTIIIFFLVIIY